MNNMTIIQLAPIKRNPPTINLEACIRLIQLSVKQEWELGKAFRQVEKEFEFRYPRKVYEMPGSTRNTMMALINRRLEKQDPETLRLVKEAGLDIVKKPIV